MWKRKLELYLAQALTYGLAIVIFRNSDYYQRALTAQAQQALILLYAAYLFLSPVYYFLMADENSENKSWVLFWGIKRSILGLIKGLRKKEYYYFEKKEKVAFLFLLVKFYFIPIMINFFFSNLNSLYSLLNSFQWYHFLLIFFFTLDTCIFAFGYLVESKALGNVVKSVEPTLLGWAVALICYPPFNSWTGKYIPWGAYDYAQFENTTLTLVLRVIVIFLLIIYVWASVALGPKASNLTNRGIVTKFPYSVIRHPAYISKNLIWWLTLLPVINWSFALGMLFWSVIYYLRAMTEEKHLGQDLEYGEYCQKVKWKFIPYVW